jgi:hypothetical protein
VPLTAEQRTPFVEDGTKQLRVAKSTKTIGGAETLAAVVERLKTGSHMKTDS